MMTRSRKIRQNAAEVCERDRAFGVCNVWFEGLITSVDAAFGTSSGQPETVIDHQPNHGIVIGAVRLVYAMS